MKELKKVPVKVEEIRRYRKIIEILNKYIYEIKLFHRLRLIEMIKKLRSR